MNSAAMHLSLASAAPVEPSLNVYIETSDPDSQEGTDARESPTIIYLIPSGGLQADLAQLSRLLSADKRLEGMETRADSSLKEGGASGAREALYSFVIESLRENTSGYSIQRFTYPKNEATARRFAELKSGSSKQERMVELGFDIKSYQASLDQTCAAVS